MGNRDVKLFLTRLFSYTHPKKLKREVAEHWVISAYLFKRVLLPLMLFYLIFGLILNTNIFDSLFFSLLIFVYSNFLPDIDIFFYKTNKEKLESIWYEKYVLLFLAPIIFFYIFTGKAHKFYSRKKRPFHNFSVIFIWGFFLLIVSSIFWTATLERIVPPLIGMLGFSLHIIVDRFL